jgi:hypothetical protein
MANVPVTAVIFSSAGCRCAYAGLLSPINADARIHDQSDLSSIASITASSTTLMLSSKLWASKPHDKPPNENKIPTTATITV